MESLNQALGMVGWKVKTKGCPMYEKLWKRLPKGWKFWDKGWIINEKLKLEGYRMDEKLGKWSCTFNHCATFQKW